MDVFSQPEKGGGQTGGLRDGVFYENEVFAFWQCIPPDRNKRLKMSANSQQLNKTLNFK